MWMDGCHHLSFPPGSALRAGPTMLASPDDTLLALTKNPSGQVVQFGSKTLYVLLNATGDQPTLR